MNTPFEFVSQMSEVASVFRELRGKVHLIEQGAVTVTLWQKDGKRLGAHDFAESDLSPFGLVKGDIFDLIIFNGGTSLRAFVRKVEPHTLSPQEIAMIEKEVDRALEGIVDP